MSNSASWGIERTWLRDQEPATRAVNMNHVGRELTAPTGPPIHSLFVYNCNPAVTLPDQARVLNGLSRTDLFTVVFDQVLTDTARTRTSSCRPPRFSSTTTTRRVHGAMSCSWPSRSSNRSANPGPITTCSWIWSGASGFRHDDDPADDLDAMLASLAGLPPAIGDELRDTWKGTPPHGGRPVQFVDVFPRTADGKVHLCPPTWTRRRRAGLGGLPAGSAPSATRSHSSHRRASARSAPRWPSFHGPTWWWRSTLRTPSRSTSRTATWCVCSTARARCSCGPGFRPWSGPARLDAEGSLAPAHGQRMDLQRVGPRYADRSGWRRMLQRRAREHHESGLN